MARPSPTVDAHTAFALALHRGLAVGSGDAVASPCSVASALGVLAPAARDDVRADVEAALAGPASYADVVADLRAAGAAAGGDTVVEVANTTWVDDRYALAEPFTEALRPWPGALARTAPLGTDPEGSRRAVNDDIARATHDLIRDLLPEGSLHEAVRAAVVNAIYLKAPWSEPFRAERTSGADFYAPGGVRAVPTMHASVEARFAATGGWSYAALPLDALLVEVWLPDAPLAETEPALDPATVAAVRAAAAPHRVHLAMPRFAVEQQGDLGPALRRLGAGGIFTPSLDHLVAAHRELRVETAAHGALLRADERGVEGAAATALMVRTVSFRVLPEARLSVDRPFLVWVVHPGTGVALFLARVTSP